MGQGRAEGRGLVDLRIGVAPSSVHFALDVAPIKDEYTLSYVWDGDAEVTWTLVEGNILRALDGAYVAQGA